MEEFINGVLMMGKRDQINMEEQEAGGTKAKV